MRLRPIDPSELQPAHTPLQSYLWAQVKEKLGIPPLAFRLEDERGIDLTILTLIRHHVTGVCFAYIPWPEYGYIRPEERGNLLEESAEHLAPKLPDECSFIRFDLPWETPYEAGEDSSDFDTADGRPPQRIRELRMNFGTREKKLRKAPTDVQPPDTLLLDIRKSSEQLLQEMKPKTRYNIRLSQRRGVVVRDESHERIDEWYAMYRETARRKGISLHNYRNFAELLREEKLHGDSYKTRVHLLMAEHESGGPPLAGIILVRRGSYAMYLYGASSGRRKELMPSYNLQWEAIRLAEAQGCRTYDLFGLPPSAQPSHPMHGLYRFKRGFGGRMIHRQGCWDYPLDWSAYERISGSELVEPGYHLR